MCEKYGVFLFTLLLQLNMSKHKTFNQRIPMEAFVFALTEQKNGGFSVQQQNLRTKCYDQREQM